MAKEKLSKKIEKISTDSKQGKSKQAKSSLKISKSVVPNKVEVSNKKSYKKSYKIDLRILPPTNLGPFAISGLAVAPAIIKLCKVKKIDVIGIIDNFQGDFLDRLQKLSFDYPLTILPAIDLQIKVDKYEDIILTCFFESSETSSTIKDFLNLLEVPSSCYGKEAYPVKLPLDIILEHLEAFDGFAIPSRVDKTPNRKCAIPILVEKYGFRTFEVVYQDDTKALFKKLWPKEHFNIFSFSNANALAQVGNRAEKIKLAELNFSGIKNFMMRSDAISFDIN
ncbi:MAG: hypothetical protein ACOX3T_03090 [Bdellovibrionota bacterium]